jgi:hypothetical protein
MHTALYCYEFVRDSAGEVYFHLYTSALIGDDDEGNRWTAGCDKYYELKDNMLVLADIINYSWVWSRGSDDSVMTDITVNGQEAVSLESVKSKYSAVENSYYEIPY